MSNSRNPQEHFQEVKDFVTTTTELTQQQLYLLEMGRKLISATSHQHYLDQIKQTANEHVDHISLAVQAIKRVSANNTGVWVEDPATGNAMPVTGFDFSMKTKSYLAVVSGKEDTWIVTDGSQLSLRPKS